MIPNIGSLISVPGVRARYYHEGIYIMMFSDFLLISILII